MIIEDTPNQLRVKLKRTLIVGDAEFFHECDTPKEEQILTAVVMNGEIHVTLFADRVRKILK
jgi:hypothetical protein